MVSGDNRKDHGDDIDRHHGPNISSTKCSIQVPTLIITNKVAPRNLGPNNKPRSGPAAWQQTLQRGIDQLKFSWTRQTPHFMDQTVQEPSQIYGRSILSNHPRLKTATRLASRWNHQLTSQEGRNWDHQELQANSMSANYLPDPDISQYREAV